MVRKVVTPPSTSRPGVEPASRTLNQRSIMVHYLTVAAGRDDARPRPRRILDDERARASDVPALDTAGAPRRPADLRPRRTGCRGSAPTGRDLGRCGELLQGRPRAVHVRRLLRADRLAGGARQAGL